MVVFSVGKNVKTRTFMRIIKKKFYSSENYSNGDFTLMYYVGWNVALVGCDRLWLF